MNREATSCKAVRDVDDIAQVAALAERIWREHFTPIIGELQVDYMLRHFQSPAAIESQMGDGYRYYLRYRGEHAIGYYALLARPDPQRMFLSKLYIHPDWQGYGAGRDSLEHIESLCREQWARTIELTVNRHNLQALRFYEKAGFEYAGTCIQDIGAGFVMDDYRMIKKIGR